MAEPLLALSIYFGLTDVKTETVNETEHDYKAVCSLCAKLLNFDSFFKRSLNELQTPRLKWVEVKEYFLFSCPSFMSVMGDTVLTKLIAEISEGSERSMSGFHYDMNNHKPLSILLWTTQ